MASAVAIPKKTELDSSLQYNEHYSPLNSPGTSQKSPPETSTARPSSLRFRTLAFWIYETFRENLCVQETDQALNKKRCVYFSKMCVSCYFCVSELRVCVCE